MAEAERRVVPALAIVMTVAVLAAVLWRIRFGVDFTDEAFYLAIPLRFVHGDRPFIDDLTVAQNAGLVIYPLVKVYHSLAHGTGGIVLWARTMWVLLATVGGAVIFRCFRNHVAWPTALLVATLSVAYIPYNLAALSYNTIGCALFTLGIYLALTPILDGRRPHWVTFAVAGAAHATAAFAYPTLALPVIFFAVLSALFGRDALLRRSLAYAGGGAAVVVALLPSLVRAGSVHLRQVFEYSSTGNLGTGAKVTAEVAVLWHAAPHPLWLAGIVALLVVARRFPTIGACLLPAVPLAATRSTFDGLMTGNAFVIYFGCLAPLFAVALANRRLARLVAIGAIAPSFVAGIVTVWTSGNGAIAATIGMFPACIASALLLGALVNETAERSGRPAIARIATLSPAVALAALLAQLYSGDAVYRDAPIASLTSRVAEGPYRGLRTTPQKWVRLDEISRDVLSVIADRPRVLFYWSFSAGYLIADRPPATCCAWIFENGPRVGMDADCYRRFVTGHNLVVKIGSPRQDDALDQAVREHTEIIAHRNGYFIAAEVPR